MRDGGRGQLRLFEGLPKPDARAHSADTVSINMNHEGASRTGAVALDEGGARLFLFLFLPLSPVTVIAIFHLLGTGQAGRAGTRDRGGEGPTMHHAPRN